MRSLLIRSLFVAMIVSLFKLCSCTYNISMAHTEGAASDVIDDTQSNTANISPNLTIPISATPKI